MKLRYQVLHLLTFEKHIYEALEMLTDQQSKIKEKKPQH